MSRPVIFDTDIGGDPDDIVALSYALESNYQVEVVISNDEHKGHRFQLIEEVLDETGSSIPVIGGTSLDTKDSCVVCQRYEETEEQEGRKEEIISKVDELLEDRDQLIWACLGAQTNLSSVIQDDRIDEDSLKVYAMGGNPNTRGSHNIKADPESAQKVLESGIETYYVTSNLTRENSIAIDDEHEVYNLLTDHHPAQDAIALNIDRFFAQKYPRSYMHDVMTVLSIEDYVDFEEMRIEMDEKGHIKENDSGNTAYVSENIDYESAMKELEGQLRAGLRV